MPPKKDKPPAEDFVTSFFSHPDPFVQFVFSMLALLAIVYLLNGLLGILNSAHISPLAWLSQAYNFITGNSLRIWIVRILAICISIFCLVYSIRLWRKIIDLRKVEKALLYPEMPAAANAVNPKWRRILDHAESVNENDWRQAIIESDIILGELLNNMDLPGDSIGDKLKAVNRGDFTSLDNAWEAHKVRNRIAHDGSTFMLTQRAARETISQYESVFREFKII